MSAVGVALSVPQVVTLLFGGVVSDRFDPRRVMLVSDIVRGAVMATLAVLSITGTLTSLWMLLGLTAIYGAAAGFFGPAFDALVPQIVPAEDLVAANALDQFVRPAGLQIFGPALTLLGAGLLGAVVTFAFLFLPGLRAPERMTSHSLSDSPPEPRVYLERPGALPSGRLPSAGPGPAADESTEEVRV
jgi:MFS family permease